MLGSNSSYALGSTGGSATTTLTKANLPATKLQLDSFSLGRGTMEITGSFNPGQYNPEIKASGAFTNSLNNSKEVSTGNSGGRVDFAASRTWTGMSTSAAPYTTNMGDSIPFNNMPPYIAVNIWKRLS